MTGRFAALSFLCDCLTPELPSPRIGALRSNIVDNSVNWDYVITSANTHLVMTSLWKALADKNLQEVVPEEVGSYLSELYSLNAKRNAAIGRQSEEILRHLNQVGIEPLVLKGAAVLLTGVIEDPAERIMGDVDIMVRPDQAEQTVAILSALGYRSSEQEDAPHDRHSQHLAPMVRDRDPAPIEVHTDLFHVVNDPQVLKSETAWKDSERFEVRGSVFRVLSPTHFVLYGAMHAQVHHECHALRKIPLRSLLDLALFLRRQGGRVDWNEIDIDTGKHGLGKTMLAYLYLGSRLLGVKVPAAEPFSPGPWLHYARCFILASCPRLLAIHDWQIFVMEGAGRVYRLFSAERMQARFGCSAGWVDLTKTRLQYSWFLARTYILGKDRSHLIDLLGGKGLSAPSDTASKEGEDGITKG